jgi:ketosteroid isomerase-like protein
MSQNNVDLVVGIQPIGLDLVPLARDTALFELLRDALGDLFAPDFECALPMPGSELPTRYHGLDGLRRLWLDWLEPWAEYTTSLERAVDLGDRVLLLFRDRGKLADGAEVELHAGAIWTVRDSLITEAQFYPTMEQVLEAAGPIDGIDEPPAD